MKRLSKKQEEENKERTLEKVKHFFTDFGAYIFTIVGTIMGPSVADMLHGKVPKPPNWHVLFQWEFYVILLIAFSITFYLDFKGDTQGKRRNWKKRLGIAFFNGAFWMNSFGN